MGGTKGQVDGNKMHRYLNVKHEGRRCENKMAYYDRASMVPRTRPCELDPSILQMYHTFGMDASRKANLEYLDEESSEPVVAYVAGNALTLLHVPSMKRQYVFGLAKSGIGSFVVHPSRETFAVGEKGKLPNVYIYEYPTLNIVDGFNTILSDVPRDAHDEARESAHSQADDLQSDTYSFEDSRVKSEEDNYRAAAERKKEVVREVLAQMRRDFEDLTRENALQRPENQLQPSDLVLDPDFNHMLEDQGETLLEEVRQACQYDSERSKVLLRKLKDRYLNDLEKQGSNTMEGQSIMALLSRHQVGSFRVPQIAGQLRLLLTQLHATLRNEEQVMPLGDLQSTQGTTTTNGNPALSAGLAGLDVTNGQEHQESKSPTVKESKGVAISTLEARKLMRLNRQSKLAALSLQRPSEDTDDPRDIQAIEHARLHLGDYKLKSGEAYEVPHKQQVNTKRKRRQMLLLQENVNSIKLRYNKRFFALRDVKRLVTHSLIEGTQQLAKLDHTLALLVANTEQLQAGVQQTDLLCNTQFKLVLNEWSDIVRNISHEETRSFTQCQINASKADASQTQWGSSTIAALTTEIDLPVLRLMSRVADHDPDSTYLSNEQCIIHREILC